MEAEKKAFNSVCSVEGGTSLCGDIEEFKKIYSAPAPICDSNNVCSSDYISKEEKIKVYNAFVKYYGDIPFVKVSNNDTHSIYACKIDSNILLDNRYLLAIVPLNVNRLYSTVKLSSLGWESFQTRKLTTGYSIPEIKVNNNLFDDIKGDIKMTKEDKHCKQYICSTLPVVVTLLFKKVGHTYQYNNSGKLHLALNTFDTIITF